MKLPKVTLTALSVGGHGPSDQRVSVAVLTSASGRSRTAQRASDNRRDKRWAMLWVVAQALAALQRPAQVTVVCNDRGALTDMQRAAHRSELDGDHAAEYAAYTAAAAPHDIEYRFASGEAMGEMGKAAYEEGLRRLEGLTSENLTPGP